jgi:hypothetical protein
MKAIVYEKYGPIVLVAGPPNLSRTNQRNVLEIESV